MATEYISREAALACFSDWIDRYGHEHTADEMVEYQRIADLPVEDVRPVAKGKWLPYEFGDYHWHKCSVCGVADKYIETVYRKGFIYNEIFSVRNFCPNCGADMWEATP